MMPTTEPTESGSLVDTDEMVLIHTFLRREFRLAAGVLRRVRPGDTAAPPTSPTTSTSSTASCTTTTRSRTSCSGRCCSSGCPRSWRRSST